MRLDDVVEVYPGGSGMPVVLGFDVGGDVRSSTHCGEDLGSVRCLLVDMIVVYCVIAMQL